MHRGRKVAHLLLVGADDVSVLIISDEGDGSYRQATGDSDAGVYQSIFASVD